MPVKYRDLRDFIAKLEQLGQLKRIGQTIDPYLEVTEVCDRTLRAGGPALLFESLSEPHGTRVPLLANLFGSEERIAMGLGLESSAQLRELGELLAFLRQPEPPSSFASAWEQLPLFKRVLAMRPKRVRKAPCQTHVLRGDEVDLGDFPIQTCWPDDVAPLITWGLVVTRDHVSGVQNMGIYRQQVLDRNRVIMRWLAHRGGALQHQAWCAQHGEKPFPVAVVLGADPATVLASVAPVPDQLPEHAFAGLLRGAPTELVRCVTSDLLVPASAEIVLEGVLHPNDSALEGPFADHTGYYNEQARFPVFTIEAITQRDKPIYHSTYTGKPPDEPAMLGLAMCELFVPILTRQFPEIIDFYLPPEGCSYRVAIVSMRKQYPGHARRVMMGVWSLLRQFMYTKFIWVVDEDIDIRAWPEVIWALSTRVDPARDCVMMENTPIDYLDFASPSAGLGSKLGIDATNKWPGETTRTWGLPVRMSDSVVQKVDDLWSQLGL